MLYAARVIFTYRSRLRRTCKKRHARSRLRFHYRLIAAQALLTAARNKPQRRGNPRSRYSRYIFFMLRNPFRCTYTHRNGISRDLVISRSRVTIAAFYAVAFQNLGHTLICRADTQDLHEPALSALLLIGRRVRKGSINATAATELLLRRFFAGNADASLSRCEHIFAALKPDCQFCCGARADGTLSWWLMRFRNGNYETALEILDYFLESLSPGRN